MQETTPQSPSAIVSSGRGVWYMSIAFLLLTIGLSWALYVGIFLTSQSIETTQSEIARINTDIQKASTDSQIVIAKIIQESGLRPSIDLKNIVTQFRLAAIEANVGFDGFSIKDDTISTQLISTAWTTNHPDAVWTIIAMMNKYAVWDEVFRLGAINSVTGDITRRTTSIELKVINSPTK